MIVSYWEEHQRLRYQGILAPLVIDTNRVLAFTISFEDFKTVAVQRWAPEDTATHQCEDS